MHNFKEDLTVLLNGLPPEQRDKLPKEEPFFGQIRTHGKYATTASKFTFQFYNMECAFFGSGKFAEIVDTKSIVGQRALRSWHSHQPYTPIIFWPDSEKPGHVVFAIWFMDNDGKVKVRAYQTKLSGWGLGAGTLKEHKKTGKFDGMNYKLVGESD